jgi:signal transduction histidine kinase
MAKVKRIAVSVSVPNLTVSGNAVLLTELFIILLDNAVKYSASGKAIRITGKKTDGHAVIHVADEGYGIREEDMPHLFDRFWRADKSRTKTDIHGYGLGLAIGKQIVDHHRGTIAVTSAVKKGTTFTITLPV